MSVRVRPPVLKLVAIIAASFFCCSAQDVVVDPWAEFNPEMWGISQGEYQIIRKSPLTPERTLELLSIGIRPKEYLERPWRSLGISEKAWLEGRDMGFEDEELDRRSGLRIPRAAWKNAVLPGLGDFDLGRPTQGSFFMSSAFFLWLGGALLSSRADHDARPLFVLAGSMHLISFGLGFWPDPRLLGGREMQTLPLDAP